MKKNIVFIHGFRGSSLGLEKVAAFFDKKNYNIYVPDIPPAGDESLPEYSPRLYTRWLANYIKSNDIKKPVLVGHSMGSIIAAAMAERYPELIEKKIIFMSPISTHPSKFYKFISPLSVLLPNNAISYITTKYLFIPKDKHLFKETLLLTKHCGANCCRKLDVYKAAKFSTHYAIPDFTFDDKEVHIIAGAKDRLIPKKRTDILASDLNAELVYIDNAGHLINYENPKRVADLIKRFLKA